MDRPAERGRNRAVRGTELIDEPVMTIAEYERDVIMPALKYRCEPTLWEWVPWTPVTVPSWMGEDEFRRRYLRRVS